MVVTSAFLLTASLALAEAQAAIRPPQPIRPQPPSQPTTKDQHHLLLPPAQDCKWRHACRAACTDDEGIVPGRFFPAYVCTPRLPVKDSSAAPPDAEDPDSGRRGELKDLEPQGYSNMACEWEGICHPGVGVVVLECRTAYVCVGKTDKDGI